MNINTSELSFSSLIGAKEEKNAQNNTTPDNNQNTDKPESKYKKSKRRQPVIQVREDNLEEVAPGIEEALGKALDDIANGELDVKHNTIKQEKRKQETQKEEDDKMDIVDPIVTQAPESIKDEAVALIKKRSKKSTKKKGNVDPADVEIDKDEAEVDSKITHEVKAKEVESNKKILVIHHYQNSTIFGPYLKELGINYTTEQLSKKTSKQLDKIISQMRVLCQNKQSTSSMDNLLFGGTSMIERYVSATTKYNLTGWTDMLKHDDSFLESWELIKIERMSFARMSPEVRFLWCLGANGLAVVNINKAMEQKQQSILPQTQVNNAQEPQPAQGTFIKLDAEPLPNPPPVIIPTTKSTNDRSNLVYNGKL